MASVCIIAPFVGSNVLALLSDPIYKRNAVTLVTVQNSSIEVKSEHIQILKLYKSNNVYDVAKKTFYLTQKRFDKIYLVTGPSENSKLNGMILNIMTVLDKMFAHVHFELLDLDQRFLYQTPFYNLKAETQKVTLMGEANSPSTLSLSPTEAQQLRHLLKNSFLCPKVGFKYANKKWLSKNAQWLMLGQTDLSLLPSIHIHQMELPSFALSQNLFASVKSIVTLFNDLNAEQLNFYFSLALSIKKPIIVSPVQKQALPYICWNNISGWVMKPEEFYNKIENAFDFELGKSYQAPSVSQMYDDSINDILRRAFKNNNKSLMVNNS